MINGAGVVLGIDVGFSATRRTTGICALTWDESLVRIRGELTTSSPSDRRRVLRALVGDSGPVAVGIDGPLAKGLRDVRHYRAAEAVLSRGILQKRGKPGQTSSPTGQHLHAHASALARMALEVSLVAESRHQDPIHERCIVEAFPNLFLAALVDEADLPSLRRDASDRYWEVLVDRSARLEGLLACLLPGRRVAADLRSIRDHDHRAALICALSGLVVAAGDYVAVGDPEDGDIVLPPRALWGSALSGSCSWLWAALDANLRSVRELPVAHPNHQRARIVSCGEGAGRGTGNEKRSEAD